MRFITSNSVIGYVSVNLSNTTNEITPTKGGNANKKESDREI